MEFFGSLFFEVFGFLNCFFEVLFLNCFFFLEVFFFLAVFFSCSFFLVFFLEF